MIYRRTNPTGVDKVIQKLENSLYNFAINTWSLTENQILAFGRVHRTGDKMRWYSSGYLEKDMLPDDAYPFYFFFIANEDSIFTTQHERSAELYCHVDLSAVKTSITHRADEEIKTDVYNLFKPMECFAGFGVIDIPGWDEKMNTHPKFSFMIKLNLRYQ